MPVSPLADRTAPSVTTDGLPGGEGDCREQTAEAAPLVLAYPWMVQGLKFPWIAIHDHCMQGVAHRGETTRRAGRLAIQFYTIRTGSVVSDRAGGTGYRHYNRDMPAGSTKKRFALTPVSRGRPLHFSKASANASR